MKYVRVVVEKYPSHYSAYTIGLKETLRGEGATFEEAFNAGIDAILTPATPSAAFGIGDEDMKADPVKMYLNDVFTVTVNMAGLPGIAVPAGKDAQGLPLGLQLIGRPFDEETLFAAGRVIERSAAIDFSPNPWW